MKTKNQTEHSLLELAITKAANEDGLNPPGSRDVPPPIRTQAWSPKEVWLTRVKATAAFTRQEPAQI